MHQWILPCYNCNQIFSTNIISVITIITAWKLLINTSTRVTIITTPTLIKRIYVWDVAGSASQMQLNAAFLDLLEQANSHLNLAYQLLQAQHPLKSASERYFSLILLTSLSLSLEPARKKVYTSHIHQHPIVISFYFYNLIKLKDIIGVNNERRLYVNSKEYPFNSRYTHPLFLQ